VTKDQAQEFEFFLWNCFKENAYAKELRLSDEEVDYLKTKYPNAVFSKMPNCECSDGKLWYKVALQC
jgi:hypothetical protein